MWREDVEQIRVPYKIDIGPQFASIKKIISGGRMWS
jgi:hypothetical protein